MRLVCPACEAKYEVPDDAIPDTGRDVQCANCGHAWFQMRARAATAGTAAPPAAGPVAEMPVPEPEPVSVPETDVSPAVDALPAGSATDAWDPAARSEGQTGLDADANGDGSVDLPDARPTPEAGGGSAAEDLSVLTEETAATSSMVQDQGSDDFSDAGPDTADMPPAADAGTINPSPNASIDGMVSEPDTPDAAPETAPEATGNAAVAAAGAAAYAVDESVLAILREEAERESNARRSDAQVLETQTDLGLAAGGRKKAAVAKPSARRDLLPDVEEINSTLRPSEPDADADGFGASASLTSPVRRGFRGGFLAIMTIAILCATLYILAPRLGTAVPALADPLQAYVGFIDGLRLHLDGMMRSATVAINGG